MLNNTSENFMCADYCRAYLYDSDGSQGDYLEACAIDFEEALNVMIAAEEE